MHTFVYARVSTVGQAVETQLLEIGKAGYEPDVTYHEIVSGKTEAANRPEFAKLLDTISRTRPPKRLVVTKLDRLGRDAVDVMATVKTLKEMDCTVKVLQLGDFDLSSSAGKIILATLAAVAEMERDLLVERTQAGLARAKAEGKRLGRPRVTDKAAEAAIKKKLSRGMSMSRIAREHGVSRQTVGRLRDP